MLARRLTADQQQQVTATTTTLLRTQGALRPLGKVNTELAKAVVNKIEKLETAEARCRQMNNIFKSIHLKKTNHLELI